METNKPTVLEAETFHDFIQFVLDNHAAPSTLIICSTKAAFFEALHAEPLSSQDEQLAVNPQRLWQTATLRLVSTSRTLKLAFCPDITHLRAYLAAYSTTISERPVEQDSALRLPSVQPTLAMMNPVELHRPTSAFSAQGLNRTFSIAVEAAHHTGSRLIMAEATKSVGSPEMGDDMQTAQQGSSRNLWDEEVPTLNATSKRLGELSVGRTVTIRSVAERWCTFEKMASLGNI